MKLIFCTQCQDVRKIQRDKTYCLCGTSHGQYYANGWDVLVGGNAVVIGVMNKSFADAVTQSLSNKYLKTGITFPFESFVFLHESITVFREEDNENEKREIDSEVTK